MRLKFTIILSILLSAHLWSQTHHIGLNFGVTQLLSTDKDPPFGSGSPWVSQLGIGYGLSYSYAFKNRFSLGFNFNKLNPNFIYHNASTFIEELNEQVEEDKILILYFLNYNLSLGYQWNITNRYLIQVSSGLSIIYDDKQKSYVRGYDATIIKRDFSFSKDRIYYGVNIEIQQSYTLIKDWNYRLNFTGGIRGAYIFDYLNYTPSFNRLLPQMYIGFELELGRRRR